MVSLRVDAWWLEKGCSFWLHNHGCFIAANKSAVCYICNMQRLTTRVKGIAGLGVGLIVLAMGLGVYFVQRDGWSPQEKAIDEEVSVYIQLRSGDPVQVSRARDRITEYDRVMEEVLSRHPELSPEWKNVKPEDNGYLKLMLLTERYRSESKPCEQTLGFPSEIMDAINELKEWDTEVVGAYLLKEADLVDEIRLIGLMSSQSMVGTDIDSFVEIYPINFIKQCADLLCLDARFAAKEGNKKRSLSSLLAAQGIAKHLCQIEAPSLIHETVGILIQLTVLDTAVNKVMSDLKLSKPEISQLRQSLKPVTNEDFTRVIKGEFYVGMRSLILPYVQPVGDVPVSQEIPDLCNLYDAHAGQIKHWMNVQGWLSLRGQLESTGSAWSHQLPEDLSAQARSLIGDSFFEGYNIYGKGIGKTQIIYRYYDAVLAIAAGEEPPVELLTVKPFIFDPVTRELKLPADALLEKQGIDTIKVP